MAHKSIYEFTIPKKVKREVTEETEAGKLTKTVESEELIKVVLKQPSRAEAEEAKLVYALEYGSGVRKGLLTNAVIERAYDKDGYIKEQQQKALEISKTLLDIQNEFQLINSKEEKDEVDKIRSKEIENEWYDHQVKLQGIKNTMSNLYNSTAETFADQKVMLWLTLFLTYLEDSNGQLKPFFKGDGADLDEAFKKKVKHFDAMSDLDDDFLNAVMDRAGLYISLWHLGKVRTKDEFDSIETGIKAEQEDVKAEQNEEAEEDTVDQPPVEPVNVE